MLNINEYIASGIIEDYCLNVLSEEEKAAVEKNASQFPEIWKEIDIYEKTLELYALNNIVAAPHNHKARVLDAMNNIILEEKTDINNLPVLNKYSEKDNWLKLVKAVLPEKLEVPMLIKELKNDGNIFQTLIWTKENYPDEVHDEVYECFLVLEGECECYVGDEVIPLGPGGFLEIPLYTHHDVKVVKGPVMAVVQRVKVA